MPRPRSRHRAGGGSGVPETPRTRELHPSQKRTSMQRSTLLRGTAVTGAVAIALTLSSCAAAARGDRSLGDLKIGSVDLSAECPSTVRRPDDWTPEAEHGHLYEMIKDDYRYRRQHQGGHRAADVGRRVHGRESRDPRGRARDRLPDGLGRRCTRTTRSPSATSAPTRRSSSRERRPPRPSSPRWTSARPWSCGTRRPTPTSRPSRTSSPPSRRTGRGGATSTARPTSSTSRAPASRRRTCSTVRTTAPRRTSFAAGGKDMQQGFASAEPYVYQNEVSAWGKPVKFASSRLRMADLPVVGVSVKKDKFDDSRPACRSWYLAAEGRRRVLQGPEGRERPDPQARRRVRPAGPTRRAVADYSDKTQVDLGLVATAPTRLRQLRRQPLLGLLHQGEQVYTDLGTRPRRATPRPTSTRTSSSTRASRSDRPARSASCGPGRWGGPAAPAPETRSPLRRVHTQEIRCPAPTDARNRASRSEHSCVVHRCSAPPAAPTPARSTGDTPHERHRHPRPLPRGRNCSTCSAPPPSAPNRACAKRASVDGSPMSPIIAAKLPLGLADLVVFAAEPSRSPRPSPRHPVTVFRSRCAARAPATTDRAFRCRAASSSTPRGPRRSSRSATASSPPRPAPPWSCSSSRVGERPGAVDVSLDRAVDDRRLHLRPVRGHRIDRARLERPRFRRRPRRRPRDGSAEILHVEGDEAQKYVHNYGTAA